ncbi:PREDICTED: E3 ubiquitin-protein ligase RGLG1-like [Erythranthe guttata]|uniref:E3 ubiquitin-protein ligase RGLG1-like n=1 Tax=Erythranthe guttata TaxID=4155 RepID=UPI00064DE259|nr:PREDICTED: E3 ubiquitin-protein ligase RGLG1-like [Erythranthe guttata]|eukprot:XP_012848392.1 PREDICTED: E3 ubiquitin-protein ligase RGLG1-like [Erythranthe guttata]
MGAKKSKEVGEKLSEESEDYNSADSNFGSDTEAGYTRIGDNYTSLDQKLFSRQSTKVPFKQKKKKKKLQINPEIFISPKNETLRNFNSVLDNIFCVVLKVESALRKYGWDSSNLIVGIDFTKSNEQSGRESFGGRCLHHITDNNNDEANNNLLNPYEHAIQIIGSTLSSYDEDNQIPCFGFGDVSTNDQHVFSFYPDSRPCNGFEEALSRYREIVPNVQLSGPSSFAPIIETAIGIVDQSGGQYHILLIIADGQVTRSVDTEAGKLSPQEQSTVNAIVEASKYPLSIIFVGVGDGPWDKLIEFDDNIPIRAFDNIQFVNFTEIMSSNVDLPEKEEKFALAALMEIPIQYKAIRELDLLSKHIGSRMRTPLPPPSENLYPDLTELDSHYSPHFGGSSSSHK